MQFSRASLVSVLKKMGVIRPPRKVVMPSGASGSEQSTAPPTDDEGSVASGQARFSCLVASRHRNTLLLSEKWINIWLLLCCGPTERFERLYAWVLLYQYLFLLVLWIWISQEMKWNCHLDPYPVAGHKWYGSKDYVARARRFTPWRAVMVLFAQIYWTFFFQGSVSNSRNQFPSSPNICKYFSSATKIQFSPRPLISPLLEPLLRLYHLFNFLIFPLFLYPLFIFSPQMMFIDTPSPWGRGGAGYLFSNL